MIEILLQGEQVQLFSERAIFWKRTCTLLIADAHWGKAATMRSAGLPIPGGTTSADLSRLTALRRRTGARRIVFLGDAIHARSGRAAKTLATLAEWRESQAALELVLVAAITINAQVTLRIIYGSTASTRRSWNRPSCSSTSPPLRPSATLWPGTCIPR